MNIITKMCTKKKRNKLTKKTGIKCTRGIDNYLLISHGVHGLCNTNRRVIFQENKEIICNCLLLLDILEVSLIFLELFLQCTHTHLVLSNSLVDSQDHVCVLSADLGLFLLP